MSSAGPEGITVREASARDREFILGLVPRLAEFERLSLHEPETIVSVVREVLAEALESPREGSKLLIAEKPSSLRDRMTFRRVSCSLE